MKTSLLLELFNKYQFYLLIFCCFHLFSAHLSIYRLSTASKFDITAFKAYTEILSSSRIFLQGTFEVATTLFILFSFPWIESFTSHADLLHKWLLCTQCRMSTHGENMCIKTMGLHHKQEISNTARWVETAFYTLTLHVLTRPLYFHFNLNKFSNIMRHLL